MTSYILNLTTEDGELLEQYRVSIDDKDIEAFNLYKPFSQAALIQEIIQEINVRDYLEKK